VAYFCMASCSVVLLWNCVMHSKLWSSRMLSGCRRSVSFRHCSVNPCGFCHWHRYCFVMACAPHLSFLVEVLSLIMACIARPRVCWGRGGDKGGCYVCGCLLW
jgi:hypothetical protein